MESKAYKKVKDLTPLEIQIKVLEDIGVKDRIEIRLLKEQLRLCGVGVTLPGKDETNAEIVDGLGLIKTLKNNPFKKATPDMAYKIGFANCYNWLNEKLGN